MQKESVHYTSLALCIFNFMPGFRKSKKPPFTMKESLIERLSNLTLHEQHRIAEKAPEYINIHINETKLDQLINDIARHNADKELEDQYLILLASHTTMNEIFGMHTTEFCARRKALGLNKYKQHRPHSCDDTTKNKILQEWDNARELEEKYRYISVAERTGQQLNIISPVIRRHRNTTQKTFNCR